MSRDNFVSIPVHGQTDDGVAIVVNGYGSVF